MGYCCQLSKKLRTLEGRSSSPDNNAHTEVKQVIAKFFGYTHYIKVFNAIAEIHDAERCIPLEIYEYRHRKASDMMDLIKRDHGNDIYVKIQESL